MSRITPIEIYLLILQGKFVLDTMGCESKSDALDNLKKMSGKDYGYDVSKWKEWAKEYNAYVEDKYKSDEEISEGIKRAMRKKRYGKS